MPFQQKISLESKISDKRQLYCKEVLISLHQGQIQLGSYKHNNNTRTNDERHILEVRKLYLTPRIFGTLPEIFNILLNRNKKNRFRILVTNRSVYLI